MNDQAPRWVRQEKAPDHRIAYAHKNGRGALTYAQIEELVKAINGAYVAAKQGKTYLAQHQARAEMNRIFGYGNWDIDIIDVELIYETELPGTGNKANTLYYRACYRGKSVVNIRDLWGMPVATIAGVHAESNSNLPDRGEAHAMALTSLESYAMRRALINLGDRFGLGLYAGGSTAAHGQYTIQLQDGVLFDWVQEGQQQIATPAPATQPSHETVQTNEHSASDDYYDPSISEDPTDYDDGSPEQVQATRNRASRAKRFAAATATVQAGNEQARENAMQQRLQAGMKQDAPMQGDVNGTAQQYAQDNS